MGLLSEVTLDQPARMDLYTPLCGDQGWRVTTINQMHLQQFNIQHLQEIKSLVIATYITQPD